MTAGVRVFFYLEDREGTLDSPTDKIMLSLTAFADELEREKAWRRTRDAMVRKAHAGCCRFGAMTEPARRKASSASSPASTWNLRT